MSDFLKFFESKVSDFPMYFEITYGKITDWCIYIYKKGCASDYPKSGKCGEDAVICNIQDADMELAFAKAQCELKEWLSDNCGGY